MASKNIEGIILSRISLNEADRLLTVFTKTEGKAKILAKGSRKIKSKMAPHIEPFTVGKYYVAEGKSFYILTGAEATEQNEEVTADLETYRDASYVAELLAMTIFEGIKNEKLYQVSKDVFLHLPKYLPEKRELILRFFEYKLLEASGYVPNFHKCQSCGDDLSENDWYEGTFEGLNCENCQKHSGRISKTTVKIIRYFAETDLKDVLKLAGASDLNKELLDIIHPFLYDILPKSPKARML